MYIQLFEGINFEMGALTLAKSAERDEDMRRE